MRHTPCYRVLSHTTVVCLFGGNSMTQRQTTRSRVMRRVGAAIAATIAVSTVASTGSHAASTSAIKTGGEIKVGIFDTFPGFCMANNPANSSLMATRTMFETLVEKTKGNDFVGVLATDWSNSTDLKTWTFNLRQGVKFHDGTDFNAAAVKTQLDYSRGGAFAAGYPSQAANLLYTLGTSVSFDANILSVSAPSTYQVVITLDRAQNDFPGTLYASGRGFMRAPSQVTNRTTCATTPVGTGPFKFVSGAIPGGELVVAKNENYWRKDPKTNAQLPYLDKITFTNVKEGSQRAAAVRKGSLDAGMFTSATEGKFIKDLRQRKSVVNEYRSPAEYYPSIWLNQTKTGSPFGNKDARLAVAKCIDRVNFVKVRSQGEATVADSLVGPTNVMYTKNGFSKFNVKEAKAHVAAYKAATGASELAFSYPVDPATSSQGNAKFLAAQWAKCGIKANLVTEETATVIANAFNSSKVGGEQMGYDALSILLFEGTDVAFNLPFVVTNTFKNNPIKAYFAKLGTLLNLNHHTDTAVDDLLFAGEAAQDKVTASTKYKAALAYLQTNGFMTAVQRQYYTLFTSKKLGGVGSLKFKTSDGRSVTQRVVTNWGIDWTGVYKK